LFWPEGREQPTPLLDEEKQALSKAYRLPPDTVLDCCWLPPAHVLGLKTKGTHGRQLPVSKDKLARFYVFDAWFLPALRPDEPQTYERPFEERSELVRLLCEACRDPSLIFVPPVELSHAKLFAHGGKPITQLISNTADPTADAVNDLIFLFTRSPSKATWSRRWRCKVPVPVSAGQKPLSAAESLRRTLFYCLPKHAPQAQPRPPPPAAERNPPKRPGLGFAVKKEETEGDYADLEAKHGSSSS